MAMAPPGFVADKKSAHPPDDGKALLERCTGIDELHWAAFADLTGSA
jgi:hypothetical protein